MELPPLDLSKFLLGNELERVEFSRALIESLKKQGFVRLVNHGFPDGFIQEIFSWVSL